jgi:hypothetical protein
MRHLSDEELVLAADGELTPGRAVKMREHLAACPSCRARMDGIERVGAELSRFDPALPSVAGARASLRARLAELAAEPDRNAWRRMAFAAAAFLVVAAGMLTLHESRSVAVSLPKPSLTPGATVPVTRADVCVAEQPDDARVIPVSVQRQVFEEYGIRDAGPRAYELDHLITLSLGGSDDIRNLWPQSYSAPVWNAHVKDALENRLHQLVCDGQLDLTSAQHDISTDWIAAYKKYFHTEKPIAQ